MENKDIRNVNPIVTNASNRTPHYNLPIFVSGNDKPSWLVDWNGTMVELDNLLYELSQNGESNDTQIENLQTLITTANESIQKLQSDMTELTQRVGTNENDISGLNTSVDNIQNDLIEQNTLVKSISETIITLQNEIAEIKTDIPELQQAVDGLGVRISNVSKTLELTNSNVAQNTTDISDLTERVTVLENKPSKNEFIVNEAWGNLSTPLSIGRYDTRNVQFPIRVDVYTASQSNMSGYLLVSAIVSDSIGSKDFYYVDVTQLTDPEQQTELLTCTISVSNDGVDKLLKLDSMGGQSRWVYVVCTAQTK